LKGRAIVDGRGNCPDGAAAAVVKNFETGEITTKAVSLGAISNNEAEYEAVILGIETAELMGIDELEIFSDSQIITHQITGVFEVRFPHLRKLRMMCWVKGRKFKDIKIFWVRRQYTKIPDQMCKDLCAEEKLSDADRDLENPFYEREAQEQLRPDNPESIDIFADLDNVKKDPLDDKV